MKKIIFIVFIFSGLYAQCSEMDEMECSNDNTCNWGSDIETGSCGSLYTAQSCGQAEGCYWSCQGGWYLGNCYGTYGCGGGSYQVDNGYCEAIQDPEPPVCSDIDTEEECNHPFHGDGCEWIEDIELENCYFAWSESNCQAHDGCEWDCEMIWDSSLWQDVLVCDCEGQYQVDAGYCEETETFEPPVCSELDTEQECNHFFHGDGCTWIPDIEYDACQSINQSNCNTTNGCDWEVDIQYGSCSNLGSSSCDATPGCWGAYTNPGWYYGWYCAGGTYVISDNSYCSGDIDNGYCTESYELGDVNLDGYLNVIDIVELVTIILNAEYSISGDLNQDGTNNITDIISLVNIVLGVE